MSARSVDFNLNFDSFSEAALSFRDMESVLDDLAADPEDNDCDNLNRNNNGLCEQDFADLGLFDDLSDDFSVNVGCSGGIASIGKPAATSTAAALMKGTFNKFMMSSTFMPFRASTSQSALAATGGTSAPAAAAAAAPSISPFSPRTTPRSPLCPHVKRQRPSLTPRSPFKMTAAH
jgi:hypothetical protein